jgi:hypothetical protein
MFVERTPPLFKPENVFCAATSVDAGQIDAFFTAVDLDSPVRADQL